MTSPLSARNRATYKKEEIFDNTTHQKIIITSEKLELILIKHLKRVSDRQSWQTPLSVIVTIIAVFCTAEFKSALFSADTWQAVFLITLILCFIWLIRTLNFLLTNECTIEELILIIKNKDETEDK